MNNSRRKMLRGTIFTTIGLIVLLLLLYKKILIYKKKYQLKTKPIHKLNKKRLIKKRI